MEKFFLNRNLFHSKDNLILYKVSLYVMVKGRIQSFPTEIVKFRDMLEDRINQRLPPLTAFPDEHRPLIAKLAHERFVH